MARRYTFRPESKSGHPESKEVRTQRELAQEAPMPDLVLAPCPTCKKDVLSTNGKELCPDCLLDQLKRVLPTAPRRSPHADVLGGPGSRKLPHPVYGDRLP